jgi:hypothetical protein
MIDNYLIFLIGTIDTIDPIQDTVEVTTTKGGGNCY